jgi:hypothetical protein
LALGLEKSDPIFRKATGYMAAVLTGKSRWSDGFERSPCFPIAVQVFTAAYLGKIDPGNPAIDHLWETWCEILQRTFSQGTYHPEGEEAASEELVDVSVKGSYVGLHSVYSVEFLGTRSNRIPKEIELAYLSWLWSLPRGLAYREAPLSILPEDSAYHNVKRWLSSLESIAMFSSWRSVSMDAVEWIWDQRGEDGLWDFGKKRGRSPHLPISDNWRKKGNRQNDYSTRVLTLLRRYFA